MTTKRGSAAEFWESLYGRHDPHSCTFAAVSAFAEAYASAQPRWIAVSERLPESWAIVIIGGHVQRIAARLNGDEWEWAVDADSAPKKAVTHWQPLPDAPEGDQS